MAGFTGVLTAVCTALVAMVAYLGVHEHQLSNDVALLRAALVQGSIADQAGAVPAHTLHKRQLVLTGFNSTGASTPVSPIAAASSPPAAAAPATAPAAAPVSAAANASASGYPSVLLQQSAISPAGYTYSGSLFQGTGFWAHTTDITAARSDLGAVTVGNTVYLIGGTDLEGNHLATVTGYDAVLEESANYTNMPQPRAHAAVATDGSTIYVVGGYSSDADEENATPGACLLSYNVAADSWTSGACMNSPRADACAAFVAGKLFVAGGSTTGAQPLQSIEVYDPSTRAWLVSTANLGQPVTQVGCAALNNTHMVVAGGTLANGTDSVQVLAIGAADSAVGTLAPLPTPRFLAALVALPSGDLLAVGGGQHINGAQVGLHEVTQYKAGSNVWVAKAPLDVQRFSFGAAYLDEGVYVIGGNHYCANASDESCHATAALASVEVFYDSDHPTVYAHLRNPAAQVAPAGVDASQVLLLGGNASIAGYAAQGSLYTGAGYWAPVPDLAAALADMSVVASGTSLYIVGGIELANSLAVASLYQYDTILQQYTRLADMPQPNCRGGAAVLGGKIYVVAGFASADESAEPLDTTMVYDLASNTWTTLSARLHTARSDCCTAAVGGRLYTAGGYTADYNNTLSTVEVYDPNTNAWAASPDMPTPRGDLMCDALGSSFVAVGGFYDPTNQFAVTAQRSEVEAFDPSTGQWSTLAPLPQSKDDMALAALPDQRLLVMGGETHLNTSRSQVATHQVYEYIGASNAWVAKAPMRDSRFRFNAAFASEAVYAFGGSSTSICTSPGNGLEDTCVERPLQSAEAFYDASQDDIFIYFRDQ